jgi:hypothetical protein
MSRQARTGTAALRAGSGPDGVGVVHAALASAEELQGRDRQINMFCMQQLTEAKYLMITHNGRIFVGTVNERDRSAWREEFLTWVFLSLPGRVGMSSA